MIKNKPIINQDPKDALLKQYALQIEQLKKQIQNGGVAPTTASEDVSDVHLKLREKEAELENEKNQKIELMRKMKEL